MALDYRKCAEEIFSHLGGKENIISAAHCATRLRLVIADNSKIDKAALENVDGVKGMFESNGQLQLIIGTGTVNKVYDEFLAVTGLTAASKADVKAAAAARAPLWKRILKVPGDVFVPILPAIVAAGLMMGLVEALGKAIPGFANTDWYAFLDLISATAFAYLPVLVAISTARVFGGNIFLGGVVGLAMIHSSLLNAWNVGSADAINSFFGVTDGVIPVWKLFGLTVKRVGYQGHVIPVILAVALMCVIEKWLHKHVPEMIDLFVTPLCTVLLTTFITFTIIGPIFSLFENWVLAGAQWLITVGFGIGSAIMGAIYPITVVMGLHHMYNVIEAGMLSGEIGKNIWMPIASAANFAQFGACLAVAVKAHNAKTKAVALPSSLSASLGITEPAIFGVNFRFMKPFVCGMIGGAIGAWFGSITKIGATTYGVTGIPGLLAIDNLPVYVILLLISAGVAFALTTITWKEEEPAAAPAPAPAAAPAPAPASSVEPDTGEYKIFAPLQGNVVAREDIPDPTFASGVLGDGVGIEPEVGEVVAPFDGEISSVTETKHAVGITGPGEMELLIHVGVDTVKMNGDGFNLLVNEGDRVTKGQKLITFDIGKIKAAGYSTTTAVLVTNSDDYSACEASLGKAGKGDQIIVVKK
ncbi:MAG: PTS glucose transporter subunit IIA [Lachnospiraceae bacterium]|nr:PTS glucose transporter subunit IIA [Lachnospiraceae bacterium]